MTTYNVHSGTSSPNWKKKKKIITRNNNNNGVVMIVSGYSQSGHNTSGSQSMDSGCQIGGSTGRGSLGRANTGSLGGNRGSLASVGKPTSSTLASLTGLLSSSDIKQESKCETSFSAAGKNPDKDEISQRVRVSSRNANVPNFSKHG